jgi:farnesyl-diphosphate farnesyltransferase
MDAAITDQQYQERILPSVSRTFALTIPQLPQGLRTAVTNAYLLCRIADTIEDDPALPPVETLQYLEVFKGLVESCGDATPLVSALARKLSDQTLPSERELVANMQRVLRVTARLSTAQRAAIHRCVDLMCYGMPHFQSTASLRGLPRMSDMDDYCYYVAGVVGEMLTELFCEFDAAIGRNRAGMQALAPSFAQGLQMTNILKDVWEDRSRGACWLPQEVFTRHGIDLESLKGAPRDAQFEHAYRELIGIAHAHLRNALEYTLLIPAAEPGIRRFCLWAVGLAVLTLRKIDRHLTFTSGAEVKVTRSAVLLTRTLVDMAVGNNRMLRRLFGLAARGLPLAHLSDTHRVPAARPAAEHDVPERRRAYGNSST